MYRIFISHSWTYSEAYDKVESFLRQEGVSFYNHSVPKNDPVHTNGTDKELYGMDEEEFAVYINRLGNLTLLENTINRSIQNDVYANKATYYKQSKFYITSSISELVNLGQDTAINRTNSLLSSWSDWNKQAIEERQEMFYRLSEMIWELR